ncbi:MAG: hypothetical protein OXU45_06760 [Candidatus Melainabacteria bacterium]|nr:hypothetical protein [Candidatus Melainabacteria bacterium]
MKTNLWILALVIMLGFAGYSIAKDTKKETKEMKSEALEAVEKEATKANPVVSMQPGMG